MGAIVPRVLSEVKLDLFLGSGTVEECSAGDEPKQEGFLHRYDVTSGEDATSVEHVSSVNEVTLLTTWVYVSIWLLLGLLHLRSRSISGFDGMHVVVWKRNEGDADIEQLKDHDRWRHTFDRGTRKQLPLG